MSVIRILLLLSFALFALMAERAAGQDKAVEFRIVESHPALAGRLAPGEQLFIRLAYKSSRPAAFWVQGFSAGERAKVEVANNILPHYPAGEGEALVWIRFRQPTKIDELRIFAAVEGWKPAATVRRRVALEWSEGAAPRPRPEWAERLAREQQEISRRQVDKTSESEQWLGGLIIALGWASVLGYLLLQPLLISQWSGGWRLAALAPLAATVPLIAHAIYALNSGSNLWPIGLIFFMPPACLYLLILTGLRWYVGRKKGQVAAE